MVFLVWTESGGDGRTSSEEETHVVVPVWWLWFGGKNNNKSGLREVLAAARTRSLHCKNDEMKALDEVFILEMKRK